MGHGCPKSLRCREGTDHNCAVSDSDTSPACGPKLVAGRAVQGEVVESEDTVLENSLTYKKRCVCGAMCGLGGKGEGGGRGQGVERDLDHLPPHHRLLPSQVCGKRKGQDGHT